MSQIPLQVHSLEETKVELDRIINAYNSNNHPLSVWGVYTQGMDQFVGVCASFESHQNAEILATESNQLYGGMVTVPKLLKELLII